MENLTIAQLWENQRQELLKRNFEFSPNEILALSDIKAAIEDYQNKLIGPRELRRIIESCAGKIQVDSLVVCALCNTEIEDENYRMSRVDDPGNWQPLCKMCAKGARNLYAH